MVRKTLFVTEKLLNRSWPQDIVGCMELKRRRIKEFKWYIVSTRMEEGLLNLSRPESRY